MSGPERERILEAALEDAGIARKPRTARNPWLLAGVLSAAAAAAALLMVPRFRQADDRFAVKGGDEGSVAGLDVTCGAAALDACPEGAVLVFGAHAATSAGYLGAFAEPLTSGGQRVFYFSAESETPAVVAGALGTQPFTRGVHVGPEHSPGSYRIHLFLTTTPVSREVLVAGGGPGVLISRVVEMTVVGR